MTQSTNQKSKRQFLLGATLIGLILVTLRLGLDPKAANRQPANFTFPQSVPIPVWKFLKSEEIAPENPKLEDFFLDIYKYQYAQPQKSSALEVEMYYTSGTRGDSSTFLAKRFKIESAKIPITQEYKGNGETGYYALFSYKGRSQLVSCINPRGVSTVTSQQFLANRNRYDLQPDRLLPALFGQEALRDTRCLWVNMSIAEDAKIAYPILEKAWQNWYSFWQNKFPQY